MTLSKTTPHKYDKLREFRQDDYDNTFYYCDNPNHVFVAFVTAFCPLCEDIQRMKEVDDEVAELEDKFYHLEDSYFELVKKARHTAPEILI